MDVLRRFGYLSTESNGHLSECLAWYRKRESELEQWIDTSRWINGETGGYLRICTEGQNWFGQASKSWRNQDLLRYDYAKRSHEHGAYILEARETGRIYRGHFNRVNRSTITNLPPDAVIEGPGYVDRNGISMTPVGDLPWGCAAICQQSISVQRLGVEAALRGDIELLRQAAMLDPLTGAVCTPPEIDQMLDEMLVATAAWLPQWQPEEGPQRTGYVRILRHGLILRAPGPAPCGKT